MRNFRCLYQIFVHEFPSHMGQERECWKIHMSRTDSRSRNMHYAQLPHQKMDCSLSWFLFGVSDHRHGLWPQALCCCHLTAGPQSPGHGSGSTEGVLLLILPWGGVRESSAFQSARPPVKIAETRPRQLCKTQTSMDWGGPPCSFPRWNRVPETESSSGTEIVQSQPGKGQGRAGERTLLRPQPPPWSAWAREVLTHSTAVCRGGAQRELRRYNTVILFSPTTKGKEGNSFFFFFSDKPHLSWPHLPLHAETDSSSWVCALMSLFASWTAAYINGSFPGTLRLPEARHHDGKTNMWGMLALPTWKSWGLLDSIRRLFFPFVSLRASWASDTSPPAPLGPGVLTVLSNLSSSPPSSSSSPKTPKRNPVRDGPHPVNVWAQVSWGGRWRSCSFHDTYLGCAVTQTVS